MLCAPTPHAPVPSPAKGKTCIKTHNLRKGNASKGGGLRERPNFTNLRGEKKTLLPSVRAAQLGKYVPTWKPGMRSCSYNSLSPPQPTACAYSSAMDAPMMTTPSLCLMILHPTCLNPCRHSWHGMSRRHWWREGWLCLVLYVRASLRHTGVTRRWPGRHHLQKSMSNPLGACPDARHVSGMLTAF